MTNLLALVAPGLALDLTQACTAASFLASLLLPVGHSGSSGASS